MIRAIQLLLGVLLISVAAQISINFPHGYSAAPITAQSMVVLMIAHQFKWKWGGICVAIYLLLGALGAPILSNYGSGWEAVSGYSSGYLVGFLVAAIVVGRLSEIKNNRLSSILFHFLIGTLIILLLGFIFLLRFTDPYTAFLRGIAPFIPGALIKIVLGTVLLMTYRRFKNLMSSQNFK